MDSEFFKLLKGHVKMTVVLFVFFDVCVCVKANATSLDTIKVNRLKEIKVKSINNSDLFSAVPSQVIQISALPIRSLSISDAIRFFSGVQIKDYGGIGGLKTINVRSMGAHHTAVFYDGIQLNNAQNGQVDLGKYSLENVEAIELYNGQKDSKLLPARAYGASSAIYLKTTSPIFINKKDNLKLGMKTGSFDLYNPFVLYERKLKNNLSISLNSEYLVASGKYKFTYADYDYDTTVVRQNGGIKALRTELGLFGKNKKDTWQFRLYSYNSERGLPGAIVANKYKFDERQKDDNFFVQANYEGKKSNKYEYLIQVKYSYDHLEYKDPDYAPNFQLINNYTQNEVYFTLANNYKVSNNLSFGISTDFLQQDLNADIRNFSYPTRYSGFISLSGKLYFKGFNLSGNVLNTLVTEKVKKGESAKDKTEFTPAILASWQPNFLSNTSIRAFYKSIFRMPTFNDLYYTAIGNSNLNPEYTRQFNLGFSKWFLFDRASLNRLELKGDIYTNRVIDKIVAIPTLNLFRWTMVNLDKVNIAGAELSAHATLEFSSEFKLNAAINYTYEKALDDSPNSFTYQQRVPYIPEHSGSLRTAFLYKDYSLNYSYIYTGERYNQRDNIKANYMPPWYTHDLTASRNFKLKEARHILLGIEVNNFLNQYYDVVLNYPMPGRNYRFHLNFKF